MCMPRLDSRNLKGLHRVAKSLNESVSAVLNAVVAAYLDDRGAALKEFTVVEGKEGDVTFRVQWMKSNDKKYGKIEVW
mgnify:CR=1 FL=1